MAATAEHTLAAAHALHLAELVERWGVSEARLFAELGLDPGALAQPGARLTLPEVVRLVERARALTGEPALGIHLGMQMRASAHGYLGFAALSASTVREALELAARFSPTRTTALALRLETEGATASLVVEERADLGAARDFVLLALVVGISQIGQALTGRPLAGVAELAFPEPAYFGPHARFGRVRFACPRNRLVFDAAVLDLPLVESDRVASQLVRAQLERELGELGPRPGFAARVREHLADGDAGFRSLEEVAARLHVSARTLKRRLSLEGVAFSQLLEEEQRDRALRLLRSPELSLEAVAERVGYSDVANFTRAFRRWTGSTPAAYRKGLPGSRPGG